MADAVLTAVPDADALFMVAAVADFRPQTQSAQKIKKTETDEAWGVAIGLEKTLDILSAVSPFDGNTRIRFQQARPGPVRMEVYDVAGRQLARIDAGRQGAGLHGAALPDLVPGTVWVRLTADGRPVDGRRLVISAR